MAYVKLVYDYIRIQLLTLFMCTLPPRNFLSSGIQESDLLLAIQRGEVTVMVCAKIAYTKAFDTVRFRSVLTKLYFMGFSKRFLRYLFSYLIDHQCNFAQIYARKSVLALVDLGNPEWTL